MRNRRTSLATGLLALTLVVGACGVDRKGTKDAILKGLEGTALSEAAKTCVANSIDSFNDSDLKKLDKSLGKGEESDLTKKFTADVTACATK